MRSRVGAPPRCHGPKLGAVVPAMLRSPPSRPSARQKLSAASCTSWSAALTGTSEVMRATRSSACMNASSGIRGTVIALRTYSAPRRTSPRRGVASTAPSGDEIWLAIATQAVDGRFIDEQLLDVLFRLVFDAAGAELCEEPAD